MYLPTQYYLLSVHAEEDTNVTRFGDNSPLWPNLFWRLFYYLAKFWTYFGKFCILGSNFHWCKLPNVEKWSSNLVTLVGHFGRFDLLPSTKTCSAPRCSSWWTYLHIWRVSEELNRLSDEKPLERKNSFLCLDVFTYFIDRRRRLPWRRERKR